MVGKPAVGWLPAGGEGNVRQERLGESKVGQVRID